MVRPKQRLVQTSSCCDVYKYKSESNSSFSILQHRIQSATPLHVKVTLSGTNWPIDSASGKQNCFAIPICSEVKTSLSEPVNERLKWILAN